MEPTLVRGQTYYFEPVDANTLVVGNIILVKAIIGEQDVQIAHRIIAINNDEDSLVFTLKGIKTACPILRFTELPTSGNLRTIQPLVHARTFLTG